MAIKAKEIILETIHQAFVGVKLGNGISLHETIVIDNYGTKEDRQKVRLKDEKNDWRKLNNDQELGKIYGIGGLSFFDPIGLRFHLPAYMYLMIENPEAEIAESIIFHLTDGSDYNLGRFAIFNNSQKEAIREFLQYIKELPGDLYETSADEINKSLEDIWSD